ncbi:MAG: HD domain-containing protein [Nitrospirae bacterium]|nr:HD domain-containing protein [Nitrospirota bacterium]
MMKNTNKRIIRTTNILALVLSVSVAVLLPLGYFVLSYQSQAAVLGTEAEAGAYFVNQLINANPDFWRFSQHRIEEALSHHLSNKFEEERRIVDVSNKFIASNSVSVQAPVITRSHDLFDSGNVVARIEIISSIRPLLKNTALFGVLGLFLGSAGFICFKIFPIRALSDALKLLYESEEKYRSSQQMLRLVLDNIPQRVSWKDRDLNYLGCNNACALDAGLSGPDEIVGKNDFDLSWKKDAEVYRADDREVMETGLPKINYEESIHKPDGSMRCVNTNKIPLQNKEGNVIGVLGTFDDITDRKEAEEYTAELYERVRDEAEISGSLLKLVETLNASLEEKELVRNILSLAPEYLGFNRMSLFYHEDQRGLTLTGSYGLTPDEERILAAKTLTPGEYSAVEMIRKGEIVVMENGGAGRLLGKELVETLNINSAAIVPVSFKGRVTGAIYGDYTTVKPVDQKDLTILKGLAHWMGIAFQNSKLYKDLEHLLINTISSLAYAIDAKSPWTKGHSERVTKFAVEIAKEMGLKEKDISHIKLCGILHDIGKIGTFDGLLDKPGKLTDEEYELVKKHPEKGVEIITPIKQLNDVIPGVLHHHERYDGKGYPMGLKGADIPLCASILAVADSFDSMTADRPYRSSPGFDYAVSELKRCSGSQFDPKIVDLFMKVLQRSDMAGKIPA